MKQVAPCDKLQYYIKEKNNGAVTLVPLIKMFVLSIEWETDVSSHKTA